MNDDMQFHQSRDNNDGYLCTRTNKITSYVFWSGTRPCKGNDLCPHCSNWTPGSKLKEIEQRRKAEEQMK